MAEYPRFDDIYVISDLHLGGQSSFQIFDSAQELVALINTLTNTDHSRQVALVINGDFIDFLAEMPGEYFSLDSAGEKLLRISKDPTFEPIFKALADFSSAQARTLVINVGNHDIELALPWTQHTLLSLLGNRNQVTLITDGSGFRCRVGDADVLCIHGNEYDSWNLTDHEKLRRLTRDRNCANKGIQNWIPNAGTQLVIEVMNSIKQRYPFVDLLKPETQTVVPILKALDAGRASDIDNIISVFYRLFKDKSRKSIGLLGDDSSAEEAMQLALPAQPHDAEFVAPERMLAEVERQFADHVTPLDLLCDNPSETLGLFSGRTQNMRLRILQAVLDFFSDDRIFDIGARDDTFTNIDKDVAADLHFVVAGHTHLEKALRRRCGKGWYFNSGTWARIIRLPPAVREDKNALDKLINLFEGGSMTALDAEPGLTLKNCTVVVIKRIDDCVCGQLCHSRDGVPEPLRSATLQGGFWQ